jgi:hypothetical protein
MADRRQFQIGTRGAVRAEGLPPSAYTQNRNAEKDARQAALDIENKKHREQMERNAARTRELAEASLELRKLHAEMQLKETEWKLKEAKLATDQALKLMTELGKLDPSKPDSYGKRLEIEQKFPGARLNKSGNDFLESWDARFTASEKSANDIKTKQDAHFTMLNDASILATGKALDGTPQTTLSNGQKVAPLALSVAGATVTEGGLHPNYKTAKPAVDKVLQSKWLEHHSGASGAAATIKRIEQANLDYAKRYDAGDRSLKDKNGKPIADRLSFDDWLSKDDKKVYAAAKAKLDEHEAGLKTLSTQFQATGEAPPAAWDFSAHKETTPVVQKQPVSSEPAAAPVTQPVVPTSAPIASPTLPTVTPQPTAVAPAPVLTESAAPSVPAPPKFQIFTTNPGALRIEDVPDAPEVKTRQEFEALPEGAAVKYGNKIIWKPVKAPVAAPVASASDSY